MNRDSNLNVYSKPCRVNIEEKRPEARPTKSERTTEAVLAAAEVLFSERGFDATTLDATAARDAGNGLDPRVMWNVVIGAICFHFGGGDTVGGLSDDPFDSSRVAEFELLMISLTLSMAGLGQSPQHA